MRPVCRGVSPIKGDYNDYSSAKAELTSRIGAGWVRGKHVASYCSYCERAIATNLAVEHIEPKDGPHGKPHLKGSWTNFLLACVNCNSTKGAKPVSLSDILLPDRDNTFSAFEYKKDGAVVPAAGLSQPIKTMAEATLKLTGLDKEERKTYDENKKLIAEDRASQRMQIWGIAESARDDLDENPDSEAVKRLIVSNAVSFGFFSVWMAVFENYPDMRDKFIDAFSGTRASGCFDMGATLVISPAPNPDGLPSGGKI